MRRASILVLAIVVLLVCKTVYAIDESNLVGHWTFDEMSGPIAHDSAGDNDGVVYGAEWTTGQVAGALSFDGVDDYVEVSDAPSLGFGQHDSFSVSLWARPMGTSAPGEVICKMRASLEYFVFGYELRWTNLSESDFVFVFVLDSSRSSHRAYYTPTGLAPVGNWHHVVAVYENREVMVYLNGELVTTGTFDCGASNGPPDGPLTIGQRSWEAVRGMYFDGSIDDVRIYDRALSAGEVEELLGFMPIHNITKDTHHATIQGAIDAATAGDTIVVPVGTYTGLGNRDIDFQGKAITLRSTDPNEPNIVAATIIDCNGTAEEPHRGFYFHSGEDASSVLEGFTIINGYGPNEPFYDREYSAGGAVCCHTSSPTIRNCIFKDNYSHWWGGGIWFDDSDSKVEGCTFKDNTSLDTGGGLCNRISGITVTNCFFTGNSSYVGGGIYNIDGISSVRNTIFVGNSAAINGGAIKNKRVISTIINCTFFDNLAPAGGAIHNVLSEGTTISNCILWDNPDSEMEGDAEVIYCNVKGGWPGLGNIDADPCFADANNGDFHLFPDSPCIDMGDLNYIPAAGETDIDGEPRIFNGRVDMGADEYYADILYVSADSPNNPGTGTQASPYRDIQDAIDAAVSGIDIHVAGGEYLESITMKDGVDLYGGFDSNDWSSPSDPNANETIIIPPYAGEFVSAVYVIDASVTIDGFTLKWAEGSDIYCASNSGATFTVTISNNKIQENWGFPLYGAGIYCGSNVKPVIVGNYIANNEIWYDPHHIDEVGGAGIYCAGSECVVSGNVVVDNYITSEGDGWMFYKAEGGGIRIGGGVVSHNIVAGNSIWARCHYGGQHYARGGGIYSDGPAFITGNTVTDNQISCSGSETEGYDTSEADGGGIYAPHSEITYNTVTGNTCYGRGGPVWQDYMNGAHGIAYGGGIYAPAAMLAGNLVSSNNATGVGSDGGEIEPANLGALSSNNATGVGDDGGAWGLEPDYPLYGGDGIGRGGGIYAPGATVVNNTVAGNHVAGTGGRGYAYLYHDPNFDGVSISEGAGIYADESSVISNTIVLGNLPDQLAGQNCGNVAYCDIGDGVCSGQVGNISVDPCFADAEYHLQCDSPCVDAGDPQSPVGYEPFPNGGIINMGAYGGTDEAARSCFGGTLCETEVDGDINGDCRIDARDLGLMVFHWIDDIPPSPPPCQTIVAGDLNDDCDVNFEDFCFMALHWCEDNNP